MSVHKIKLNYNGLIRDIVEALDADEIEYLQENAWRIEIGIELLNRYLTEIAQRAIETKDPFLVEWSRNLMIITEDVGPQKGIGGES